MVDISTLRPGDQVYIVREKTGTRWNTNGHMDKYLGTVMTVRKVYVSNDVVSMEEDQGDAYRIGGWSWFPEMIDSRVDDDFDPAPENELMDMLFGGK